MKTKKRWSWTEKQLRKTRSKYKRGFWKGPSKSFLGYFKPRDKAKLKDSLIKELKGYEQPSPLRTYRNQAKWEWW